MGWKPRDQFSGDDTDFIDAAEFVRRKPLFDKIEQQNRDLKDVRKVLKQLQDHHTKVKETEFKNAVEFLKNQKKEALAEGDLDKVVELDDQISDMKAAQKAQAVAIAAQTKNSPHPDFTSWVENNKWYAQDAELRVFADEIGLAFQRSNPDLDPNEILKKVTDRVKKAFPEKFQNQNRTKPSAVDGGSTTTRPASKEQFQMSEEEIRVMKSFERQGIMTKEEYITELKKVRGAK